jgi:hypothetical protein
MRFFNHKKGEFWAEAKDWAKLYNKIVTTKILPGAPPGFRTRKEIWDQFADPKEDLEHASDFFKEKLPAMRRAMSAKDFNELAKDLADIAGLHGCVDFLVINA